MTSTLPRIITRLTPGQYRALTAIAAREKTTLARLVIEALQAQYPEIAAIEPPRARGKYPRKTTQSGASHG